MKNLIKKVINKGKAFYAKASFMLTTIMLGISCPVYAQGLTNKSSDDLFKSFIGQILGLVTYVGVGLFVWGLVQFFLSIKNDEPEKKQGALMTAVAGVGIITIKTIVNTVTGISL